jgi:hypothetical protein
VSVFKLRREVIDMGTWVERRGMERAVCRDNDVKLRVKAMKCYVSCFASSGGSKRQARTCYRGQTILISVKLLGSSQKASRARSVHLACFIMMLGSETLSVCFCVITGLFGNQHVAVWKSPAASGLVHL